MPSYAEPHPSELIPMDLEGCVTLLQDGTLSLPETNKKQGRAVEGFRD